VELARREPDVYGGRITGGGFGGSVVIVAKAGTGRKIGERIVEEYGKRTQQKATLLVPAK
jgi:galactokinase